MPIFNRHPQMQVTEKSIYTQWSSIHKHSTDGMILLKNQENKKQSHKNSKCHFHLKNFSLKINLCYNHCFQLGSGQDKLLTEMFKKWMEQRTICMQKEIKQKQPKTQITQADYTLKSRKII